MRKQIQCGRQSIRQTFDETLPLKQPFPNWFLHFYKYKYTRL